MSNPRTLQELADSLAASARWRAEGQGLGGPYSAGYADALLDTRATVLAMIASEREPTPEECPTCGALYGEMDHAPEPCLPPDNDSYCVIERDDIGRAYIEAFGKAWRLADVIGRVQPIDVGKRVYLRGGVLQVENNEQRDARLARHDQGTE
jgi:hypothetical protein